MNSIVNFLLESGISLALLVTIYVVMLRKETYFRLNRLFLLGSVLFSVLLPFLRFRIFSMQPVVLPEVTVTPYRNLLETATIYGQDLSGSVEEFVLSTQILILIYLAGVAFFLVRLLIRFIQLFLLVKKNKVVSESSVKLVVLKRETGPFSFLNYVFVGENFRQHDGYERMLMHELEHVKQGHSFDVIFLELLAVFQWFNPFVWVLRRAIRENHEYLADRAVLSSGISCGYYKSLLLNQFVGSQLTVANNFNYSLIKNRVKMMSKIKSKKLAISKIILGIVVAGALIVTFACEQKNTETIKINNEPSALENDGNVAVFKSVVTKNGRIKIEGDKSLAEFKQLFAQLSDGFDVVADSIGDIYLIKKEPLKSKQLHKGEQVFLIVENMPEFPGGDKALLQWIAKSVKYPAVAQKNGIEGKVYVSFVVTKTGEVANVTIARGVDPSLNKEALRVVSSMPAWKPGRQKGKAVNVNYTVPINFVLE